MFSYCRNNPVNREDVLGTYAVSNMSDEEDGNPFNDYGGLRGGGGTGVRSSYYAQQNVRAYDSWWRNSCYNPNMSNGSTVPTNAATVPEYAKETLKHIKNHNGSPPNGYKGGKPFENDGRNGGERLPKDYGPFYEYDVYPKVAGQDRGLERLVIGNGAAWYTNNHYQTFIRVE